MEVQEEGQRKRNRECVDTVVYARINARQFVLSMVGNSYVMHQMTHQWEEDCCDGADNHGNTPIPNYCERLLDYWLHHNLLPAENDVMVFTNKYDNGTPQARRVRRPPALSTDGSLLFMNN